MKCKVFIEEFIKKVNGNTNINRELNSAVQGRVSKNAEVLESIVNTILLCGRQNLALRDGRDDSNSPFKKKLSVKRNPHTAEAAILIRNSALG
ncbi:hypothetical protein ACF0H5_008548 [Mactra antiquata]